MTVMSSPIQKTTVNEDSLALQQTRAIVVGTTVIYVEYSPLISDDESRLIGEFQ